MNNIDDDFEKSLHAALAVPVPDDLAQRVLIKQGLYQRSQTRHIWAIAASLILSIGLGLVVWQNQLDTIPDQMLAHIYHEPALLQQQQTIPMREFRAILAHYQGQTDDKIDNIGQLISAEICAVDGKQMIHIVVSVPPDNRSVTVFYNPPENQQAAIQDFADEFEQRAFYGQIAPQKKGQFAIISEYAPAIPIVKQGLQQSVHF